VTVVCLKTTVFGDVTQLSVLIGTEFSEGQHIFPNCCYLLAKICGVTYKGIRMYRHFAENISLYLTTVVAHVTMRGELLYFSIDNTHLMYTVHPVFFRSHELVV
jgi:hypothetical protein